MIKDLGVQLYTIGGYMQTEDDIKRSFEKLADIGYKKLHTAGMYSCMSPEKFAEAARNSGLEIIGTQFSMEEIENDFEYLLQLHEAYGTTNIGIGALPGAHQIELTLDYIEDFIERFNVCAEKLAAYNMKLTYHHHEFEFFKHNGKTIMDRYIEKFDKNNISFVLDTYWLQAGGVSILEYMSKCKNRVDILHLKDYKVIFEDMWNKPVYAEILEGNINFKDVISMAEEIGVKHYIVEQDICPGNPFDSLKTSYDNLKFAGLLEG